MTKTQPKPRRRAWIWAFAAVAAWGWMASNTAEAQSVEVPAFVVAQVLGHEARPARATDPGSAEGDVHRVAARMRSRFQDQLIAGVRRPSVELAVHFDFDSDRIHAESGPEIAAAAEVLTDHFPETRFRVAGYTDAAGRADYNQRLSERRARAVWRRLVEAHGISAERLEMVGHGEAGPTEMTDAQRRRVELQIVR